MLEEGSEDTHFLQAFQGWVSVIMRKLQLRSWCQGCCKPPILGTIRSASSVEVSENVHPTRPVRCYIQRSGIKIESKKLQLFRQGRSQVGWPQIHSGSSGDRATVPIYQYEASLPSHWRIVTDCFIVPNKHAAMSQRTSKAMICWSATRSVHGSRMHTKLKTWFSLAVLCQARSTQTVYASVTWYARKKIFSRVSSGVVVAAIRLDEKTR